MVIHARIIYSELNEIPMLLCGSDVITPMLLTVSLFIVWKNTRIMVKFIHQCVQ